MSSTSNRVRNENGVTTVTTSRGNVNQALSRSLSVFKGALIVSAAIYVTITWALQAVARFN